VRRNSRISFSVAIVLTLFQGWTSSPTASADIWFTEVTPGVIEVLSGVTSIPDDAFANSNISSIVIPATVQSIGQRAFLHATNLNSITFLGTSKLETISAQAFYGATNLTSITPPQGVKSIGQEAFSRTSIVSITIPESVTSISDGLFDATASLTSVTLPNGVTSIGNGAFWATSLASIVIPSSVTSIGYLAFADNDSLTSIELPEGVTSIGYEAFRNDHNLRSARLPDSLVSISDALFIGATALTNFNFPKNLTHIGRAAFVYTAISSVTVPGTVNQIDQFAFAYMPNLKSAVIQNGVTRLLYGVFSNNPSLTTLVIPNSVTTIGYAFEEDRSDPDGDFGFQSIVRGDDQLTCATYPAVTFLGGWGETETFGSLPQCPLVVARSSTEVAEAAAKAAAAKREAEKQFARADLTVTLKNAKDLSVDSFAKAEIPGITSSNIAEVQAELLSLPEEFRSDIKMILKVAYKYEVVGKIASEQVTRLSPDTFVEVGLIPEASKNKTSLVAAVKKLPAADRDSYAEIKAAIEIEIKKIEARSNRLAAIVKRASFRSRTG